MKLTVLKIFSDINTGVIYNPNDIIEIEGQERLQSLFERKLAKPFLKSDENKEDENPLKSDENVSTVNINQNAAQIKSELVKCTDKESLISLIKEEEEGKNRVGVIKAINERISEL